jgi:ABC-type lipoprotein export system ATPase subunit
MTQHYLDNWKQYLTEDDYNYLIQYIENIKHNISNNKMIILSGPARSGKSTLINDIKTYLGDEICGVYGMSGEIIYSETIKKLGIFCEINEIFHSKKNNRAIINLIKYKQSLIAVTNFIENVNINLLDFSKIIQMNSIF